MNNINLNIKSGEIVGYIGLNGAGKSTTIKMLTGILHPTSGKIVVNNIDPYKNRKINSKNIGVIFGQRNQLFWDLPVIDTFEFNKQLYEISDKDFKNNIMYFNDAINLEEIYYKPYRKLSLGQSMRANFALAFLHNPKVVFLDEPTIGLDVLTKEQIRKCILDINKRLNTTVLFTSHDMEDINMVCNRIILLEKGQIKFDNTLKIFMQQYGKYDNMEIFFSNTNFAGINNMIEGASISAIEGNKITIKYNKAKCSSLDIIKFLINNTALDIVNIGIKECTIKDIVKEIYKCEAGTK